MKAFCFFTSPNQTTEKNWKGPRGEIKKEGRREAKRENKRRGGRTGIGRSNFVFSCCFFSSSFHHHEKTELTTLKRETTSTTCTIIFCLIPFEKSHRRVVGDDSDPGGSRHQSEPKGGEAVGSELLLRLALPDWTRGTMAGTARSISVGWMKRERGISWSSLDERVGRRHGDTLASERESGVTKGCTPVHMMSKREEDEHPSSLSSDVSYLCWRRLHVQHVSRTPNSQGSE